MISPYCRVHKTLLQGSDEWFAVRRGRATGSRAKDIISAAKAEYSKGAGRYIAELIGECLAPQELPVFNGNALTDRGTELEPLALEAFSKSQKVTLAKVGFISCRLSQNSDVEVVGLSPDALITDDTGEYVGGVEVKCPLRTQHVLNAMAGGLPDDYKQQVHWALALTELPEWHFWSWHPDMQPVHHVIRPDGYTDKVRAAIEQFVCDYAEARARYIPQLQLETQQAI